MNSMSHSAILAQVLAARQAMETVINGNTPDHAKWSGVNSFIRRYNEIATQYTNTTGDSNVRLYNLSLLRNPFDMLWSQQKGLFDIAYMDILTLQNLLTRIEPMPSGPLYNLFVSGDSEEWSGKPFQIEMSRCVREYTNANLTKQFGNLDTAAVAELKRAPCIFAYESGHNLSPKFGYIRDITHRQGQVRVEYNIHQVEQFLTAEDLGNMMFELDISRLELHRTHWAVKEVNLPKELHSKGITLPTSMPDITNAVDVSKHIFDVALSFPGETRPLVDKIVQELEGKLGPNRYFYDNNYVSQLAQPSLDTLLQGIYTRAKLDVVFLSSDYQKKDWCGVEFRAVKEIMFNRENNRVMFVRTDDGSVEGVFKTDGYVDARKFSPAKIADFICQRLALLPQALPED